MYSDYKQRRLILLAMYIVIMYYPGMNTTNNNTAKVETYKLVASNGNHIRMATKVTFPDGRTVKFIDRIGRREAIRQAQLQLAK